MSSSSSQVQEYWLPGYELSRHVILSQLHLFLGPSTSVRPYSHQGREGYLINGIKLTNKQVDDLKRMSKEYERQQAQRMTGRSGAPSDNSIHELVVVRPSRRHSPDYGRRRR